MTRPSVPADVPAQRQLWKLAFGDSDRYLDNFYQNYYRPERVLVLEQDGAVRAMTAWFDTEFLVPEQGAYRAAYLYAVATHPAFRGRGLAGRLLADADAYFRQQKIPAVTTVPAEPSLHAFFRRNGFRECFVHRQAALGTGPLPPAPFPLEPVGPESYRTLREDFLRGTAHIAYPTEALAYQNGCCALSGGGLYRAETAAGPVLLCAEYAEDGTPLLKELLASPEAEAEFLRFAPALFPGGGLYRVPDGTGTRPFGMLKWLSPEPETQWDWNRTAYLGLAFD